MNILILSASPRRNSLTFRFSDFFRKVLSGSSLVNSVDLIDFDDFDFPVVGKGTFGKTGLSTFQNRMIGSLAKADLVFICSPEYNWTANAELFILFDRLGTRDYRYLFEDKVFASVGVSSGRGGRQPALDINKVLSKVISFLGVLAVVSPKILEVHEVSKNITEDLESNGISEFDRALEDFLDYSFQFARHWANGKPSS